MAAAALAQVSACEQKLSELLVCDKEVPADEQSGKGPSAKALLVKLEGLVSAALVAAEEEDVPHVARDMQSKAEAKRRQLASLKLAVNKLIAEEGRARAKAAQAQRAVLLSSSAGSVAVDAARRDILAQASLLDQSRDVTNSLKRTMQRVSMELERMDAAQQMLNTDAQAIDSTVEKHAGYRSAASTNEAHLKEIRRQERIDQIILAICFGIFICVVAWIFYKRTFAWFVPHPSPPPLPSASPTLTDDVL